MADGGKRRSARLMALEEQKQGTPTNSVVPTNHEQGTGNEQSIGRKRGRKNKGIEVYQEDKSSQLQVGPIIDGNSSVDPSTLENQTDRFISYILDKLDITDGFGLFSMPDNMEAFDCNASLISPGDLATLRQKYKDGMYTTLEQFEIDVYIVFGKAVDSNTPDSIAYKEAKQLLDNAKQVFQSVRNDPEKAEEKLSKWHQETFGYKKSVRNDQNAGTSGCTAQPEYHVVPNAIERGRPRGRKESEYPESSKEQQRHTYKSVSASNMSPEMVCDKQEQLVYNKNAMDSTQSMLEFVKNAGPAAKIAAEEKCLENSERVQAQTTYNRPITFTAKNNAGLVPLIGSNNRAGFIAPYGSNNNAGFMPPFLNNNNSGFTPYFGSRYRLNNPGAESTTMVVKTSLGLAPAHLEDAQLTALNANVANPASSTSMNPSPTSKAYDAVLGGTGCQPETDEQVTVFSLMGTKVVVARSKSMASSSNQVNKGDK